MARRPFGNFRKLFLQPQDLLSAFFASTYLLSTSVIFTWPGDRLSGRVNFCQLLSTFRVAGRPSIKFRNFFMPLSDLQLLSTFRAAGRVSINFRLHPCCRGIFCQLPSTLCTAGSPFKNILCVRNTFHQLSVRCAFLLVGRPSVYFRQLIYSQENFRRIFSNFPANRRHSVKLSAFIVVRKTFR